MRILDQALTFDDVLLVPAYSEILPREVDLSTQLTRRIRLNMPLLSAAMDTVTEARLAITIAQEGGIGIVHKSMSIEAQAREVGRVKKFESGIIKDPITVPPTMTIREVLELTHSRGISGVPVVVGKKVVGIVTHRDLRFEQKLDAAVSSVMTPQERLITVRETTPRDEVLALLHKHRIEKVLVVNSEQELAGMITVKDIQKAKEFPRACKDERGRLRVGAAVGTTADTLDRLESEGRVVARYLDVNPNCSLHDIAGITNERGNVVGLMPHPEHAVEDLTGPSTDGRGFFAGRAVLGVIRGPA